MTDLFTTYDEAHRTDAYPLARRWVDHTVRVPDSSAPTHRAAQIDELATMAALAGWLLAWLPAQIHKSLLAGATLAEVVAAAGRAPQEVHDLWRAWAAGQVRSSANHSYMRDIPAQVDQVAAVFAEQL